MGVNEMARWVKVLADEPDDLNPSLRCSQRKEKTKHHKSSSAHMCVVASTSIHTITGLSVNRESLNSHCARCSPLEIFIA